MGSKLLAFHSHSRSVLWLSVHGWTSASTQINYARKSQLTKPMVACREVAFSSTIKLGREGAIELWSQNRTAN